MFETWTATGRRRRLIVLAIVVIGVCAWGDRLSRFATRLFVSVNAEELESDLQASLPLGSNLNVGTAWFARHGVEPSVDGYNPCSVSGELPADSLFETGEIRISLGYLDKELKSVKIERHMQPRWTFWRGR